MVYQFKDYSYIATIDNNVEEGLKYQYKEGSFIKEVQLLKVEEQDDEWEFELLFIEDNRKSIVRFSKHAVNTGYSGMWRLVDNHSYDLKEVEAYRKRMAEKIKEYDIPKLEISSLKGKKGKKK